MAQNEKDESQIGKDARYPIERKRAVQAKPRKGSGERFLDCPHYEDCLDLAALRNWKAFTCESCPIYTHQSGESPLATPEKKEATRICRECGKNHTIQPTSPLCASCIGKHAWKDKGHTKTKKTKTAPYQGQTGKIPTAPQYSPYHRIWHPFINIKGS